MEIWYLVSCRVNLILDKSGFKVLGKAFLSDFLVLVFGILVLAFFCLCESFHSSSMCLFFGFSFYRPVTLVKCPSFVPFAATRFPFLLFLRKNFWLSTLPSNSSVHVGLSFSIWKGINVHSQSSSV